LFPHTLIDPRNGNEEIVNESPSTFQSTTPFNNNCLKIIDFCSYGSFSIVLLENGTILHKFKDIEPKQFEF
jgi:hypothetical protein